jgi:hypothetical protein
MELYAEQVVKAREMLYSDLKEVRVALHKRDRVAAMNRLEGDLDTVMDALWKSPSYSTSSGQLGGDADRTSDSALLPGRAEKHSGNRAYAGV